MSAYDIYQPGPHYTVADSVGASLVDPDQILDTYSDAQQRIRELAADDVDTSDAQVWEIGGYWLARCSSCGALADDDGYVYPEWTDVLYVAADVNQAVAELPWYLARGPEWFVSHERHDLRCSAHAPADYVEVNRD